MAIVFSYPPIGKNDVQPSDRLLLSQMTVEGNPTRSITVNNLRQYLGAIIPTNIVIGSGTTNKITKWVNGAARQIGDSSIEDTGSEINVPYKLNINNATSNANGIVFPHPAGGASGIVNMYYNGAVAGSRFVISRAATGGAEIELQSNGDVNINRLGNGNFLVGGEVTLDDYGSGAITGTPTFNLTVDANGKIIEEALAGGIGGTGTIDTLPVFTAANTIGDSIVTQDTAFDPEVYINGSLGVNMTSNLNFEVDVSGSVRVEGDNAPGGPGTTGTYWLGGGASGDMNFGISSEGASTTQKKFYIGKAFNGITPYLTMWRTTGASAGVEGRLQLNEYGSGNFTTGSGGLGAATYNLEVDASGNVIETTSAAAGYKSVQVFKWPNGNPVAYVNFPIGANYFLPFDNNAGNYVQTGTYPGVPATFATYAWSASNVVAPGFPTGLYTTFTLGPQGAGTWQITTAQHWFDQNQFLEVNAYLRYNGSLRALVDERVNDGAGNRMFYGTIIENFLAGDTVEITIEFLNGTGANPFPSDTNVRPTEVTFTKLV